MKLLKFFQVLDFTMRLYRDSVIYLHHQGQFWTQDTDTKIQVKYGQKLFLDTHEPASLHSRPLVWGTCSQFCGYALQDLFLWTGICLNIGVTYDLTALIRDLPLCVNLWISHEHDRCTLWSTFEGACLQDVSCSKPLFHWNCTAPSLCASDPVD